MKSNTKRPLHEAEWCDQTQIQWDKGWHVAESKLFPSFLVPAASGHVFAYQPLKPLYKYNKCSHSERRGEVSPFMRQIRDSYQHPINYALSLKCKICPERMAAWLAHNDAYSAAFHQSCCQLKYNRTCSLCPAFVSGLFAALQRIQKHLELLSFSWEEQSCPTAGLHLNNSSFTEVTL